MVTNQTLVLGCCCICLMLLELLPFKLAKQPLSKLVLLMQEGFLPVRVWATLRMVSNLCPAGSDLVNCEQLKKQLTIRSQGLYYSWHLVSTVMKKIGWILASIRGALKLNRGGCPLQPNLEEENISSPFIKNKKPTTSKESDSSRL